MRGFFAAGINSDFAFGCLVPSSFLFLLFLVFTSRFSRLLPGSFLFLPLHSVFLTLYSPYGANTYARMRAHMIGSVIPNASRSVAMRSGKSDRHTPFFSRSSRIVGSFVVTFTAARKAARSGAVANLVVYARCICKRKSRLGMTEHRRKNFAHLINIAQNSAQQKQRYTRALKDQFA